MPLLPPRTQGQVSHEKYEDTRSYHVFHDTIVIVVPHKGAPQLFVAVQRKGAVADGQMTFSPGTHDVAFEPGACNMLFHNAIAQAY